ncbi:MAG: hypothetical protein DRG83_08365 [Deltaproteobacteria bacterium]|nr:MAG: hypothetical protein DRG83_08365 [Deltaproteobacteria bacterium]
MKEEKRFIEYLKKIRGNRFPAFDPVPEEIQWIPSIADIPSEESEYLEEQPAIIPDSSIEPIYFYAFLDGVQRTQIYDRIVLSMGVRVPIHIAHIAAGIIIRVDKHLRFDPQLCEDRLLLVLPYEGIKEIDNTFPEPPFKGEDEEAECLKKFKVFWCDITHPGAGTPHPGESSFMGERLFNISKIRMRAQTRVAVWRQRLELLVLKKFIEKHSDKWILVDGPLFYDYRWLKSLEFDASKAKNVVGYIKTIRERPKDWGDILRLGESQRSRVRPWDRAKCPKMGRSDEEGEVLFPKRHLKWYIRERIPPRGWSPPDHLGLAAIDVAITTLGLTSSDDPSLSRDNFDRHKTIIDSITLGVWRERYPGPSFPKDFSYYTRLYPVEKLEQILHSRLLPPRMLATLGMQK